MSTLGSVMFGALSSALSASQLRQQVDANNIANVNTPGYRQQTVHFASLLRSSLAASGWSSSTGGALPMTANSTRDLAGFASPATVTPVIQSAGSAASGVQLNAVMSDMAVNQIQYGALVQEMTDQFAMLRTSILG